MPPPFHDNFVFKGKSKHRLQSAKQDKPKHSEIHLYAPVPLVPIIIRLREITYRA